MSFIVFKEMVQFSRLVLKKINDSVPGRDTERHAETRHTALSSAAEGLLDELGFRLRVYPPERPFAGLLLRARHFYKVPVQREVMPDRVLKQIKK